MEVVTGDVQALGVVGEPETHEATPEVAQFEDGLVLHALQERGVRFVLAGHAPGFDVLEAPVRPDGAADARVEESVYAGTEAGEIRSVERSGQVRLEKGHDGERWLRAPIDRLHRSVGSYLVEAAVEGDHLPIQCLERPEAEVAALPQLREADVTVVVAVEQGVDGRGLEQGVVERVGFGEVRFPDVVYV